MKAIILNDLTTVWVKPKYQYPKNVKKPEHLNEMINIAQTLGADFDFVRVDLYDTENAVFFSEFTFTPIGGYMNYYTDFAIREMYQTVAKNLQK
jgi:hypothetical protein